MRKEKRKMWGKKNKNERQKRGRKSRGKQKQSIFMCYSIGEYSYSYSVFIFKLSSFFVANFNCKRVCVCVCTCVCARGITGSYNHCWFGDTHLSPVAPSCTSPAAWRQSTRGALALPDIPLARPTCPFCSARRDRCSPQSVRWQCVGCLCHAAARAARSCK